MGSAKRQRTASPNTSLSPNATPATAADPAGQVDEERMLRINRHAEGGELRLQPQARDRVAQEQVLGVLVIDEMAVRIGLGLGTALGDGGPVIAGMLDHRDPGGAQAILLPLPASADMWTVVRKPILALMMPIDRPRLPVEPTATL